MDGVGSESGRNEGTGLEEVGDGALEVVVPSRVEIASIDYARYVLGFERIQAAIFVFDCRNERRLINYSILAYATAVNGEQHGELSKEILMTLVRSTVRKLRLRNNSGNRSTLVGIGGGPGAGKRKEKKEEVEKEEKKKKKKNKKKKEKKLEERKNERGRKHFYVYHSPPTYEQRYIKLINLSMRYTPF